MAPYDIPTAAHDMILRFMGMNFSAITAGTAMIPSSIDGEAKPVPQKGTEQPTTSPAETPEQDKAKWEGMSIVPNGRVLLKTILYCQPTIMLGQQH